VRAGAWPLRFGFRRSAQSGGGAGGFLGSKRNIRYRRLFTFTRAFAMA